MKIRYILLLVAIIIIILMILGSQNISRTVSIGDCSASFYTIPMMVTSDLCSANKTCEAKPEDMQNNAIVDVILCACTKAEASEYSDTNLNNAIEKIVREYFGYSTDAYSICSQKSILTKRFYA